MSDTKPAQDGVRVNERDLRIFAGLFESRVMQRQHLAALYFDGSDAAAKERIGKKLLPAGYLAEVNPDRHPTEKAVYGLGRLGFEELKERGVIATYEELVNRRFAWERLEDRLKVRPITIEHELAVMGVKAALMGAFRGVPGLTVSEFLTWPLLYQFAAGGIRGEGQTKPDGYLRLVRADAADEWYEEYFFVEVDRGAETQDTLLGKVADYHAYNGSAAFARFLGAEPADAIHFRTLFVFGRASQDADGAEERRNNFLHRVCQETPERFSVWATTCHEIARDPLGPIWMRPHEYARALAGTLYDPAHRGWRPRGGRDNARDRLVAERVVRYALERSLSGGKEQGDAQATAQVLPFPVQQAIPPAEEPLREASAVRTSDLPTVDRREKEHRYLRHLIARLAEECGVGAKIRASDTDGADVLLKRETLTIGCMIALTTTADEERAQIRACLDKGCSRVLVVSPDRERRSRIAKLIPEFAEVGRIDIAAPEDVGAFLDQTKAAPETTEKQVGKYKVMVTRPAVSPQKRAAIADVIARSLARSSRSR